MAAVQLDERAIFEVARKIPGGDVREAYLRQVCAEPRIGERVRALLRAYEENASFLEVPAVPLAAPADEPSISERPGTVIEPYKLLEQIGEGGFGVVFMAEQTHPVRRKVALKIVKPGMDTRQVVARFEAERQALALMDHPNIARVFDGGETATGRPYFVMELVKGVPVTDFCDQNHLSVPERLRLFVTLCQAVQHAHQKGIIHRDIKPSNVLVTLHDGGPLVKVIDFGIAKATGQQLTEKTLFTNFAQMIGTPIYMSPEQAQMSATDVDTRSDVYSLGVLLYELLTGTTPFDRERLRTAAYDEIRRIIREEEPAKPSTRLNTLGGATATVSANRKSDPKRLTALVRGELDWIVMKALEKNRGRRYETANGLAMDLQRYLNDEPVLACPPSVGYRVRKFVRRNKGPALAAAIVLLALVCGMIGTTWGMLRATTEANQKEQARDRAVQESERATRAERNARHRLFQAKLAEARTSRLTRQPGQRFETWEALTEAAQLARELELDQGAFLTLRSEAIACLALTDVRALKTWEGYPPGSEAGTVSAPAFDEDLKRYARSDEKGNISVRRVDDDRQLMALAGHGPGGRDSGAFRIVFSPDGTRLAVAYRHQIPGQGTNFRLWDWQRGEVLFQTTFNVWEGAVGFSPDGRRLALGHADGTVTVHEVPTGRETSRMKLPGRTEHVGFSPDGTRLAIGQFGEVQVREVAGGELVCKCAHPGLAWRVAWHPAGVLLSSGGGNGNVYLWDSTTGQQHAVLHGHQANVVCLAFAPCGDLLVSGSWDGTSRLWDPWTGQELLRFSGYALNFNRDGSQLVSGHGRNVALWEVTHTQECRTLPRSQGFGREEIGHGSFSPDGRRLAVGTTKGIRLWDVPSGKEVAFQPTPVRIHDVQFHPKGTQLFTGAPGAVYQWPVQEHEGTLRLGLARKLPVGGAHQISLDREGRILGAAGSGSGWVVDLTNVGAQPKQVQLPYPMFVSTSPDGKWLAIGTWMGHGVRVWDTRTGQEQVQLIPEERGAWPAFSPDGRWLVTWTPNGCAIRSTPQDDQKPNDAGSWKIQRQIPTVLNDQPGGAAFSADGQLLAVSRSTRVVQLLDPATGHVHADVTAPDAHLWGVIGFSPDKTLFVVRMQSGPGAVRVWNLRQIRERLKEIGLDWNLPAYPPAPPRGEDVRIKFEVDLGELKTN